METHPFKKSRADISRAPQPLDKERTDSLSLAHVNHEDCRGRSQRRLSEFHLFTQGYRIFASKRAQAILR